MAGQLSHIPWLLTYYLKVGVLGRLLFELRYQLVLPIAFNTSRGFKGAPPLLTAFEALLQMSRITEEKKRGVGTPPIRCVSLGGCLLESGFVFFFFFLFCNVTLPR